jgi:hypothetical protein
MAVITTLIDRVVRFFTDRIIKDRKFNATIDHIWADQLSPPQVHAYLKPFVKVAC